MKKIELAGGLGPITPRKTRVVVKQSSDSRRPKIDPCEHLGLVKAIALRYRGRGVDLDDLIGCGCVGLMTAVRKFNPQKYRLEKFGAYAFGVIRFSVLGAFNVDKTFHIPRYIRHYANKIKKGIIGIDDVPESDPGGAYPDLRVAVAAALDVVKLDRLTRLGVNDDGSYDDYIDMCTDSLSGDDFTVPEMLGWVSAREALVVQYRLGLDGADERSFGDVAHMANVTPSMASYLYKMAFKKIVRRLQDPYPVAKVIKTKAPKPVMRPPSAKMIPGLIAKSKKLKGRPRRVFIARTVLSIGPGGVRWAIKNLHWCSYVITKGIKEVLEEEVTKEPRQAGLL